MYLEDAHFVDRPIRMGYPSDEEFLQRNFELCRAVNLTSLCVVLDKMKERGLPKEQAECFYAQAQALLQLMRTENNRLRSPTITDR